MVIQPKVTVEDFEAFIYAPENADRSFELIGGEIVEVVSNSYSSEIGAFFVALLIQWGRSTGRVTGADGGYVIMDERYIPDAAYISKKRQPEPSRAAYNPNAPDLAVEVLSPAKSPAEMRIKVANYVLAGTVVWVVDPDKQRVEVYTPGAAPKILGIDDTLDGGDILPDLRAAVKTSLQNR
jgi:Uma2 family endonuclease